MAVILSDGSYRVRKRPHEFTRDAQGTPVPAATEQPEPAGSWSLRLDPAAWRLRPGDLVDGPAGRTWLVTSAMLRVNTAAADVDYVAITATLEPPERT